MLLLLMGRFSAPMTTSPPAAGLAGHALCVGRDAFLQRDLGRLWSGLLFLAHGGSDEAAAHQRFSDRAWWTRRLEHVDRYGLTDAASRDEHPEGEVSSPQAAADRSRRRAFANVHRPHVVSSFDHVLAKRVLVPRVVRLDDAGDEAGPGLRCVSII